MNKPSPLLLGAALAAIPMTAGSLAAQTIQPRMQPRAATSIDGVKFAERFWKWSEHPEIVGIDKSHPIYRNSKGDLFSLDPATGDMQMIAADYFARFQELNIRQPRRGMQLTMVKWNPVKFGDGGVTILGFDAQGNVIQQNQRGEKFYLDGATGDMIFVK